MIADQKTLNYFVNMIESNQRMDFSITIMKVSKILKLFYIDSCVYSLNFLQNFQISVKAKFQITEDNAISPKFYAGILPLNS